MACRLFGTKPLSEPMLAYSQLDKNNLQWNHNQNPNIFIEEDALENISQNGGHFVSTVMYVLSENMFKTSASSMNIPYGIQMQFASETWSGEGDYLSITEEFIVCSGIGLFVNMEHYGTRPANTLQKLSVKPSTGTELTEK